MRLVIYSVLYVFYILYTHRLCTEAATIGSKNRDRELNSATDRSRWAFEWN